MLFFWVYLFISNREVHLVESQCHSQKLSCYLVSHELGQRRGLD